MNNEKSIYDVKTNKKMYNTVNINAVVGLFRNLSYYYLKNK